MVTWLKPKVQVQEDKGSFTAMGQQCRGHLDLATERTLSPLRMGWSSCLSHYRITGTGPQGAVWASGDTGHGSGAIL